MTEICYNDENSQYELTVMGHCNAGRINGNDLCCCGVSMLVYTLMEALSSMKLNNYEATYGGGWCYIRFDKDSKDTENAKNSIATVMKGFELLAKSYPSNVNIINTKRRNPV